MGIGADHMTASVRSASGLVQSGSPTRKRRQLDPRIARAMRLLEERFAERIDYDSIASAIGLSRHRFHHLFAQEIGDSAGEYVRQIRLNAAAKRLRSTKETVGYIANYLGYDSQSAFTSAFRRRFGASPGRFRKDREPRFDVPVRAIGHGRIAFRECGGFRVVAKRYFGSASQLRYNWTDFLGSLPPGLQPCGQSLYLGLIYDDVRLTSVDKIRYDCCVVVSDGAELPARKVESLHSLVVPAGLYASIEHGGRYELSQQTYSLMVDHRLLRSRYTLTDDPTIELYRVPPSRVSDEEMKFTLMVALY